MTPTATAFSQALRDLILHFANNSKPPLETGEAVGILEITKTRIILAGHLKAQDDPFQD